MGIPGSLLAAGLSPNEQWCLWKMHKKCQRGALQQLGVVEEAVEELKQHSDKGLKWKVHILPPTSSPCP